MTQSPMRPLLLKPSCEFLAVATLKPRLKSVVQLPLKETSSPLTTRDYSVGLLRPEVLKVTLMGEVRILREPMHGC